MSQAPAPSTAAGGGGPSPPATEPTDGASPASDPGASGGGGPIGGDIGDRTKGSAQAQITGGLTASVDLPFGAAAAFDALRRQHCAPEIDALGKTYIPFRGAGCGEPYPLERLRPGTAGVSDGGDADESAGDIAEDLV